MGRTVAPRRRIITQVSLRAGPGAVTHVFFALEIHPMIAQVKTYVACSYACVRLSFHELTVMVLDLLDPATKPEVVASW
jgi:hypothetical protein